MNKSELLKQIKEKLGYEEEKMNKINHIIEETFIIGKKNKEKMINRFQKELGVERKEANTIYEIVMELIGGGLKAKLKHPFKNLDETK